MNTRMSRFVALVVLLLGSLVEADRDFYKILGLSRSAGVKEIKAQYRKLSLKYHPDKNEGDPKAAETFSDVANGNIRQSIRSIRDPLQPGEAQDL